MASKSVLKLNGFEQLLEEIQKAEGNIDEATQKALTAGATELENQLRAECSASGVPDSVTSEIKTKIKTQQNQYRAEVGWDVGTYDENNPSAAFKAIFLNYGTPRRKKHGKVQARGFISRAKRKSKKNVKAAQQSALDEILKGLKES